ncbi:hypothetical protein [Methylobacterium sp. L1A1]|uniref:hypothetical protein n=1 Tax=Methylorubrum sp. POS3 TaxID=2998492 RepID=UPI0010F46FF1|nr:hypothetical protein [Methylobacterium sp. L1A1]
MTSQAAPLSPGRPGLPSGLAAAEEIFAHALRDFIRELCLIDGGVLIGWIRGQHHGNIADMVASSAELFFNDSVLTYADGADVYLDFGHSMQVVLDMEFSAQPLTVFFKLVLDEMFAGVAIQRVVAADAAALCLDGFADILTRARLRRA